MKALLLLVIQILDASIRAKQGGASGALDATWDGPWTLARFVNILSSYFISAWYLLFSLPRSNVMNTTPPAWINTHPQNMLLHHSLFRVLQNQYLNIYDLNELWTNNCNCTGVLGCIKHSRWWIITRLQPPKCITLLCFNKCFIQTRVNRASISVYWSIKVHIDIQSDLIWCCRYVYVKMWSSVMSARRYTSYKCPRLKTEYWHHFNLSSI